MLYFWKAWDSRISNMVFPCVKCKIHTYKNTQIHKYKVLKHPNLHLHLHLQMGGASSRSIFLYREPFIWITLTAATIGLSFFINESVRSFRKSENLSSNFSWGKCNKVSRNSEVSINCGIVCAFSFWHVKAFC